VRERQPRFEGFLPLFGELSMRARMTLSPRSMAAWWMVGFEDRPERSAEICVFEVFGDAVEPGRSAAVGMGLHPFRDPRVTDDFAAPRLPIDVTEPHDYAVRWTPGEAAFSVDGDEVRVCPRPPDYPMQMMVAVFDFPRRSVGGDDHLVPELVVDHLRWSPLAGG
jgi:hypothetical protein